MPHANRPRSLTPYPYIAEAGAHPPERIVTMSTTAWTAEQAERDADDYAAKATEEALP